MYYGLYLQKANMNIINRLLITIISIIGLYLSINQIFISDISSILIPAYCVGITFGGMIYGLSGILLYFIKEN